MPKTKGTKAWRRAVLLLAVLWLVYTAAMALVYCIPDTMIREHQENGAALIQKEGLYPTPIFDSGDAGLDNFTDDWMLRITVESPEVNAVQRAMIPTYARYWHGYQLYLRPLLVVLEYRHIRYILYALCILLFALCFSTIEKAAGKGTAMGFTLALILVRFSIVSVSLQFVSCFVVMMLAILCIAVKMPAGGGTGLSVPVLFAVAGSLVNFLDLLTAPVITLGVPLLVYLGILEKRREETSARIKCVFVCSLYWLCGYGMTWLAKWGVGALVLRQNVFAEAWGEIVTRSGARENPLAIRREALVLNLGISRWLKLALIVFTLLILFAVVFLAFRAGLSQMRRTCKALIPELLVALYPYVWFMVLAQQTAQHNFYTYRAQMVTVFAQCVMLQRLTHQLTCAKASK